MQKRLWVLSADLSFNPADKTAAREEVSAGSSCFSSSIWVNVGAISARCSLVSTHDPVRCWSSSCNMKDVGLDRRAIYLLETWRITVWQHLIVKHSYSGSLLTGVTERFVSVFSRACKGQRCTTWLNKCSFGISSDNFSKHIAIFMSINFHKQHHFHHNKPKFYRFLLKSSFSVLIKICSLL